MDTVPDTNTEPLIFPPGVSARFEAKVEVNGPMILDTRCHLWVAGIKDGKGPKMFPCPCGEGTGLGNKHSYGQFRIGHRMRTAHIVAYELMKGPVPEGLQLDHLCSVRHCVNAEHLEAVPGWVNIARGRTGANQASKTHCPQGHEYTPDNTYVAPATSRQKGNRKCRACKAARR